jgi:hypothetical protein
MNENIIIDNDNDINNIVNIINIVNIDDKSDSDDDNDIIDEKINTINQYIDCCIGSNCSDYDIALTIYEILKNKYRYIGNRVWQYYDDDKNIWINDDKTLRLKSDIKNIVCDKFLTRSLYWIEKSKQKNIATNISLDHQLRSARLLQCCYKLKDNKFILILLKEAKQLFCYNE